MAKKNRKGYLRSQWAGDCDIVVISAANNKYQAALNKAYQTLYLPHFPLAEGNTDIGTWQQALKSSEGPVDYTITLAGDRLRTANPHIRGMVVSCYFKNSNTGYLSYIVVDPAHRTEGLGHALFRIHEQALLEAAKRHGKSLSGSFLDCVDPNQKNRHQEDQGYNPEKRIKKYQSWGGRIIPINYALPDETNPAKKIYDWTLLAFPHPHDGKYPTQNTVKAVLADLFKSCGVKAPAQDAEYQRQVKEVSAHWHPDIKGPYPNKKPNNPAP